MAAPSGLIPAERLERLKVIVKELSDVWPDVLRRQTLLQELGRREDLHEALRQTYAAHISNMLQQVLIVDLVREIGALVLDRHPDSASVNRALFALSDPDVLAALEAEYRVVRPLGHVGGDRITPEMRAAMDEQWHAHELKEQLQRFGELRSELAAVETELAGSATAGLLWKARSKGVAHYDVIRDGQDWKLWRVEGTGLTWGQVDDYVDLCTRVIDVLYHLVRQAGFDLNGSREIAKEYVDEYIAALVTGLQSQKRAHAKKLESMMKGQE